MGISVSEKHIEIKENNIELLLEFFTRNKKIENSDKTLKKQQQHDEEAKIWKKTPNLM